LKEKQDYQIILDVEINLKLYIRIVIFML